LRIARRLAKINKPTRRLVRLPPQTLAESSPARIERGRAVLAAVAAYTERRCSLREAPLDASWSGPRTNALHKQHAASASVAKFVQ